MTHACNWHPALRWDAAAHYEAHMDAQHPGWRDPAFEVRACSGCDVRAVGSLETASLENGRCMHCPPLVCPDCGEPDDRECSCWVSIEDLNLADKKALFAADGTFNLGADGELTVA